MSDKYRQMLQRLLPRGPAWTREPGSQLTALLQGLAVEAQRVEDRALALIEEADPRTTTELIDDWERVCGLPGDCTAPTAIADRRALVVQKLLGHGDPNLAFWQEQAEALGFTFGSIEEYRPFSAGDNAGDHVIGLDWLFCWVLVVATRTAALNELLRCTVEGLTPLHTEVEVFAQPYATWLTKTAGVYAGDFNGVASGPAGGASGVRFITVGSAAEIRTSTDGNTWTKRAPGGGYADDFQGVCSYSAARWFAVGSTAAIQRSADNGVTWSADTPGGAYAGTFTAVASTNDGHSHYLTAVGTLGEIQINTNVLSAVAWTHYAAAGGYANTFYAVAFDSTTGTIVIAGNAGEIQYYNYTLYGDAWYHATPDRSFAGTWLSATFANGFFWLGGSSGELQQSRDGITWRRITNSINVYVGGICGDGVEGILYCDWAPEIWARNRIGPEMQHVALTVPGGIGSHLNGVTLTNDIAVCVGVDATILRATRFGT